MGDEIHSAYMKPPLMTSFGVIEGNSVFICISKLNKIEQISAEELDSMYRLTPY